MKHVNKFTYKELERIENLLPTDWKNNLHFIIKYKNAVANTKSIELGNRLTIKVENYIINQPDNFSLSENWNKGTVPPEELLEVEIIQILGKMVKVNAVGKYTRIEWEGWLPRKSFKIQ